MEFPLLQEYNHSKVCSTTHYLTAVNKGPEEIFTKIKWVYDEGCMNIQKLHKWRREYLIWRSQQYTKPLSRRSNNCLVFENIQQIYDLLEAHSDVRYFFGALHANHK